MEKTKSLKYIYCPTVYVMLISPLFQRNEGKYINMEVYCEFWWTVLENFVQNLRVFVWVYFFTIRQNVMYIWCLSKFL